MPPAYNAGTFFFDLIHALRFFPFFFFLPSRVLGSRTPLIRGNLFPDIAARPRAHFFFSPHPPPPATRSALQSLFALFFFLMYGGYIFGPAPEPFHPPFFIRLPHMSLFAELTPLHPSCTIHRSRHFFNGKQRTIQGGDFTSFFSPSFLGWGLRIALPSWLLMAPCRLVVSATVLLAALKMAAKSFAAGLQLFFHLSWFSYQMWRSSGAFDEITSLFFRVSPSLKSDPNIFRAHVTLPKTRALFPPFFSQPHL